MRPVAIVAVPRHLLLSPQVSLLDHRQQPRAPAEVSRLLSVSEGNVGSVDMEEASADEEEV